MIFTTPHKALFSFIVLETYFGKQKEASHTSSVQTLPA